MSLRLGLGLTRGDHPVDELVEGGERGLEVGIRAGSPRRVDGAPGERVVPRVVEALDRLDRPREVAREHRLSEDRERAARTSRSGASITSPSRHADELSRDLAGEDVAEAPDVAVGERPLEQHAAGSPGRRVVRGQRVADAAALLEALDQRPDADLVERELEDRDRELGVVDPDPRLARRP